PPPPSGTWHTSSAPSFLAICSIFLAMTRTSCGFGVRPTLQGEADLQVIPVDDYAHRTLPRLRPHPHEEFVQWIHLLIQRFLAGVTLDHDRLIKQQYAALRVISPHPPPLRERRRAPETYPKHLQGFTDPIALVDRLIRPILVRYVQHDQRRRGLA